MGTITRRELLRLSAGTLLTLGLWPGRLRADDSKEASDFTFIAVNDLHFREEACAPWFHEAVAAMKTSAPEAEFCLLCGDLADDGEARQHNGVRDAFQGLGIPCHAAIGNHDYLAQTDRKAYEEGLERSKMGFLESFIQKGAELLPGPSRSESEQAAFEKGEIGEQLDEDKDDD